MNNTHDLALAAAMHDAIRESLALGIQLNGNLNQLARSRPVRCGRME